MTADKMALQAYDPAIFSAQSFRKDYFPDFRLTE